MGKLENEYTQIVRSLDGDSAGVRIAKAYMDNSPAIFHGIPTLISFIPKFYGQQALLDFAQIIETTNRILDKVVDYYYENSEYRKLFGFDSFLERLVLTNPGYECKVPFGRYDIFLDEESGAFKFCELNTDGSAAMLRDSEGACALAQTDSFSQMLLNHKLHPQDLFSQLPQDFMRIYAEFPARQENPHVGIVDFRESANVAELERFKETFIAAGISADVIFVDELVEKSGELFARKADGEHRVDAIYRRAVTLELMEALEEPSDSSNRIGTQALIDCFESDTLCLIGGFRTQIAHCKQIFFVLHHEMTAAILDADELDFVKEHIPYTAFLVMNEDVIINKDAWIIKPPDGFSGHGVYAGKDCSPEQWQELIEKYSNTGYILQEYCEQYSTPNFSVNETGVDFDALENWNILTGLYTYGGKFAGVYIRTGKTGVIVDSNGAACMPVFLCDVALNTPGLESIRAK
jgi:hypothetical protein